MKGAYYKGGLLEEEIIRKELIKEGDLIEEEITTGATELLERQLLQRGFIRGRNDLKGAYYRDRFIRDGN